MKPLLSRFINDESGVTAVEYGLLAALLALAIVTSVKGVSAKLNTTFGTISGALK